MAKKSRLNPNKGSRGTLKQLEGKGVLSREKVGLRHVIKADGTVHYLGYNIGYDWQNRHMPNFYPGVAQTYSTVVQYNGERAELTATLGRKGWEGHLLDVGSHFPPNHLATQLLASRYHVGRQPQDLPIVYGDAVLVTDNRMHWVFNPHNVSIQDVERIDDFLSTPRNLIKSASSATIFFHVEPDQKDIFTLMMHGL